MFAQGPDHCPQMNQVKGLCFSNSHSLLLCSQNVFICHLLCATLLCLIAQLCLTLCNPMDCSPPGSSVHRDSPGKNTGMGCHALLQRIFPTQGLNPGLPHCWWILYHLSHQGSSLGVGMLLNKTVPGPHSKTFSFICSGVYPG